MPVKVSVIVISFNTREKTRRCLGCVEPHHELVVVDNASSDGSAEMIREEFPHVKLLVNPRNVGFGQANNQGFDLATGDLVLLLNSDAYAFPGAIDKLAEVFQDATVVAAGGSLLYLDGRPQESVAAELTLWRVFLEQTGIDKLLVQRESPNAYWRTNLVRRESERTHEPVEVDQVMGAVLMIRASHGMPSERFDPRYFLYCEDSDLCLRLRRHGRIVYDPEAQFYHELGSSSARDPALGVIRYNWGKELYFRVHRGKGAEFACLLIDRLGAALRLLGWSLIRMRRMTKDRTQKAAADEQIRLWWRVLRAPRRSAAESIRTPEPPRPEGRFA